MKSKIIIIIGVSALIVAVILGGVAMVNANIMLTKDITDDAIYRVNSPGNVTLEEGKYELWVEIPNDNQDYKREWPRVNIEVFDENNNSIPLRKSDGDKNFGVRYSYGQINITTDGEYRFVTDTERTVYLIEPLEQGNYFEVCVLSLISGVLVAVIGLGLIIVGIRRKRMETAIETPPGRLENFQR
jgi:hypothetical protein